MNVTEHTGQVRKAATTWSEREQLAREASVLRAVAHPGVVRLLAVEGDGPPTALVFERVAGGALLGRPHLDEAQVADLGARLATIVADLHDLGWAHGAIQRDHVLIGAGGHVQLCGFGSAVHSRDSPQWSRRRRQDLMDLASLLAGLLEPGAGMDVSRLATPAKDARRLARQLADHRPGAKLRVSRSRVLLAAGLAVATAAGGTVWEFSGRSQPVPCPAVDDGCRAVSWPSASAVHLGAPFPAVIVNGRWRCTVQAYPAVLNSVTGAVWLFDSWPSAGDQVRARLVTEEPGITALAVQPERSGCDELVLIGPGRPSVLVDPR